MQVAKYKPSGQWKGEVEIEVPSQRTRLRYFKESKFEVDEKGEINATANLDSMLRMYDLCAPHVKKVNIEHETGQKYKDFEEMADDALCNDICSDIINYVMSGGALGEG